MLTQDHRNLEALFKRVPGALDDPEELSHLRELISEHLSAHAAVEEQLLYPALLEVAGGERPLVLRAIEDHHAAEQTLLEALTTPPGDERLGAKLALLADVVPAHAEREETELFDLARRASADLDLDALGERAEQVKATAPSQPHPHLTGKPLVQQVLAVPTAIADRALSTARQVVSTILARKAS